ncbi:MAG: HD domain-containing protein, partial [Maricaulaceae bacterium]
KTSRAPYATLKVMNEAGVLGRYLIEFGGIVARTQFNMHHAYTVDEHTLRLVNYFHDLCVGVRAEEHPMSTAIAKTLNEKQKRILYMACLLHDTGKGKGDQCIEGAQLARKACRRMGLAQDEIDTVAWLVRRHLDFSETAQRRDISDPATISEFGTLVGSQERLDLLLILTVVDIRAVGPGIWNDWKGSLLRQLYNATAQFLDGKEGLAPASMASAAKEQFRERLQEGKFECIAPITHDLGDSYWLNFSQTDLLRHARFFEKTVETGQNTATETRRNRDNDITELWVLTHDRPGVFADITRAISASGASIAGARLHTGLNKRVMNVFYLQNPDGKAFGRKSNTALSSLKERAQKAASGESQNLTINLSPTSRRASAIPVKAHVRFPQTGSDDISVIELTGRDRPGLLCDLADCLFALGQDVLSAHIEVVGEKAIDVFYVSGDLNLGQDKPRVKSALMRILRDKTKADAKTGTAA